MNKLHVSILDDKMPKQDYMCDYDSVVHDIWRSNCKVIVLDDDPTGVQTVHNVMVLTNWGVGSLIAAMQRDEPVFYILTNSRSLTAQETRALHTEIVRNILSAAKASGVEFEIISRGDSTLRGHYPLETQVIKDELESGSSVKIDGEIICPFFKEGGRYTLNDVHYVLEQDQLVPAADTEFAQDATFGYSHSNLKHWIEEKTKGAYLASKCMSISLEMLRQGGASQVRDALLQAQDFQKIVVNAVSYEDLQVFIEGLLLSKVQGKRFLYRTAASFVRVRGGIRARNLLQKTEMVIDQGENGGLIIVGSHVKKTTLQLNALMDSEDVLALEFNVEAIQEDREEQEIHSLQSKLEEAIGMGQTVVVYTSRNLVKVTDRQAESNLSFSVLVSKALVSLVQRLSVRPKYIVTKGGITSSDIGFKGLGVAQALVLGQILPGIPVWRLGQEAKYPGLPFIIFPGNVGDQQDLTQAVKILDNQ